MSRRAQVLGRGGFLCDLYIVLKKIFTKFGFFVRESSPDTLSPSGILKIPRATRRALGIFKIPSGLRGI